MLKRIIPVVLVVGAAIALYEYGDRRLPGKGDGAKRSVESIAWESARLDRWKAFKYCDLGEREMLALHVERAVGPTSAIAEHLDKSQIAELQGVLTRFFFALSASDWREYLTRIDGIRRIPQTPYEHQSVPLNWKLMTGSPMPVGMAFEDAFEAFWKRSKPRPVAISIADPNGYFVDVGSWSKGARTEHFIPRPDDSLWINSASTPLPALTQRIEEDYDQATIVTIDFAARTAEARYLPMFVTLEWTDRWILWSAGVQTDETVFWPM